MSASTATPGRARALAFVVALVWFVIAVPLLGDYAPG